MRKEIIAIGILAMIAVCATLATAASSQSVNSNNMVPVIDIEMSPDTLNLDGNGKFITAFIDVDVLGTIDPMEFYLTDDLYNSGSEVNNVIAVAAWDYGTYWAVKFPRATVLGWLEVDDLTSETSFETEDLYVKHITNEKVDFIAKDDFIVMINTKSKK